MVDRKSHEIFEFRKFVLVWKCYPCATALNAFCIDSPSRGESDSDTDIIMYGVGFGYHTHNKWLTLNCEHNITDRI